MTKRLVTLFKFGIVGVANTTVDAVVFALLAVVGVPVMAPVAAFKDSPAGKLPTETLNVYEPVPPVALTVCE